MHIIIWEASACGNPRRRRGGLAAVWAAGAAVVAGLFTARLWRFRRLVRLARPAGAELQALAGTIADRLGVRRRVRVLLSDGRVPPLVWGTFGWPAVLVPTRLAERLSRRQIEAVFVHELAHLRRGDPWVRLLELPVLALYWWHPAAWLAARQLRRAAEQCCDAHVVAAMPACRRPYADALLSVFDFLAERPVPALAGASGLRSIHSIERRLEMIMQDQGVQRSGRLGWVVWVLAAAVLPLGPAIFAEEPAAPPATQPAAPDVLAGVVDPYDEGGQRALLLQAAGTDGELDADECAAAAKLDGSFVRAFDKFSAMLAFDRDGNGKISWAEADAYRRDLRRRVLAACDADKDGRLTGEERTQAAEALAAGRLAPAYRALNWKEYDKDGDGRLSADEMAAYREASRKQSEQRRQAYEREMLERWDADKDGKLSAEERKAWYAERYRQSLLRRFDKDKDGKLSPDEDAEKAKYLAQVEQRRREYHEQYVKPWDADGDGKLSGEETRARNDHYRKKAEQRSREIRKQWDADGDGKLSGEERQAMYAEARRYGEAWRKFAGQVGGEGLEKWKAVRKALMDKYDADKDGGLGADERSKFVKDTLGE